MTTKYDYLIVGSGLFGATFAYCARKAGKRCLVIDKRPQLGGNLYCEPVSFPKENGQGESTINVHKYGAHIFHTSNKQVWDFVNSIVEFNRYTNSPVANYHGELYNLPFNMNTFNKMWPDVHTPAEAQAKLETQRKDAVEEINRCHREKGIPELKASPRGGWEGAANLEEQALCLVGRDIFYKLIKEYTEKQWGRDCKELPAFIIKRLPVRMIFDNNYFNDKYQGIPIGGYNKLIDGLLSLPNPFRRGAYVLQDKESFPTVESQGEAEGGLIDTLTGIDMPFNIGKASLNSSRRGTLGYRETADCANYELLLENAKRMRKEPTEAESVFWSLVNGKNLGVKFRRQHIIGNYIADFVCLEKNLIVELDGGYHDEAEQQIEDTLRSNELKEYGFTILRLKNEEIIGDPEGTVKKLKLAMWLSEKAPLREGFREAANKLVYTGPIDEFFNYNLGKLDWRTVSFKTRVEDTPNYQGNAVVNYTSHDEPYTRVIEHKHFEMFGQEVYDCPKTVVSEEYSTEYKPGMEQFYPVNNDRNNTLCEQYRALAHDEGVIFPEDLTGFPPGETHGRGQAPILFGGRLAQYKYFDMAPVIEQVLNIKEF